MAPVIIGILIGLGVLFLIWVVFTYLSVQTSVIRPKSSEVDFDKLSERHKIRYEIRKKNNQHLYDMAPEDLSLTDPMGNELKAWFVPVEGSKKFVICVHGYKCNGPDEFSHMLPFYHDVLGYNYLLPDHAAHGRSSGKHIGFGSYEAGNVLLWVKYLVDRFGDDIEVVLHGISMGAATVMLANESDPPEQVKAVIEDCGYTSAKAIMLNTLKGMIGVAPPFMFHSVNLVCKLFFGYDLNTADCIGRMGTASKPLLFIHGTGDDFVPFKMGEELFAACDKVEKDHLWVDDAVHAYSYYDAKDAYEAKVTEFLGKYVK